MAIAYYETGQPAKAVEAASEAVRYDDALALWGRMQPLNMLLWTLPFNPVAKAASNLSGRPVGDCRRPVLPLSEDQMAQVRSAMEQLSAGGEPGGA